MYKKSLHFQILLLILGFFSIGVVFSIYFEIQSKEQELLEEKLRASRFMAQPVLNAIYEDMLEERADMARHLVNALGKEQGVELRIIRSNGVEEAFRDFKTVEAVKKEYGEVKPEWVTDHLNEPNNVAEGVDTPEFKRAYETFKGNWNVDAIWYITKGENQAFTYLQPIEKRSKCNTCHTEEDARGILMITTDLEEMYAYLAKVRNKWILLGIGAIVFGGVLLSILIKKSITGPLKKTVNVIKSITDGKGSLSERVQVSYENEVGYLASAFNNMLDTLEKRDQENKRLFELVAKSREEWISTFDAIQDMISIHDKDYRITKVNKALARKLGKQPDELVGMKCHEVFYNNNMPHQDCPHAKTLANASPAQTEADDFAFEGTYKIITFPVFDENGAVCASVHIVSDISREKLLREQLLHSEKLSSVGKLVAGIAHELNNPLMGIMGFSQILMDTPSEQKVEAIKPKLQRIYHESLRTAKIVQNLLTFARSKKTERGYHDINEIIKHTMELREYSLKTNNIEVKLGLEEDLPRTMVDQFQLQQVFINILNNAEDAMVEHRKKGKLEIKTSKSRNRITISFRDDGPGVPKEHINKVFDPFFSTKEVGKGTGLGLSISHGIITEHGGTIEITNNSDGEGATVTIELPVFSADVWGQVKEAMENKASSTKAEAGKSVLVVDDEKSIRDSLYDILKKEKFRVDTAREGREALEMLDKERYSIVITDMKMPGISGKELYNSIVEKHPYLKEKVIVLTGDVFSPDVKDFLADTKCPYILKPFEPKELLELLAKLLARPAGAPASS